MATTDTAPSDQQRLFEKKIANAKSPFFKLPMEIRVSVYHIAFESHDNAVHHICSQIRAEALPLYFHENMYHFHDLPKIARIGSRLSHWKDMMKSVCLHFTDVHYFSPSVEVYMSWDRQEVRGLQELVKMFPKIEHLRIEATLETEKKKINKIASQAFFIRMIPLRKLPIKKLEFKLFWRRRNYSKAILNEGSLDDYLKEIEADARIIVLGMSLELQTAEAKDVMLWSQRLKEACA